MTDLRDAAESATAGVPVVRGLEWRSGRAETVLGRYLVGVDAWSTGHRFEMRSPDCGDSDTLATADDLPSIDAAEAAAQADYEQRILSALNPDFLSELDTARAEIESISATAEANEWRAETAESALTAAQARIAELEQTLRRAAPLVRLLTVRQVLLSSSNTAIEASGLNPWAINEGLATGDERIDAWWIDATLSPAVKEPK